MKKKILIIEDNSKMSDYLQLDLKYVLLIELKIDEFTIDQVSNKTEAMEKMGANKYDLIAISGMKNGVGLQILDEVPMEYKNRVIAMSIDESIIHAFKEKGVRTIDKGKIMTSTLLPLVKDVLGLK